MTNGGPNVVGACRLGTSNSVATNFASTPKQAEQHDNDQALSVSMRKWSVRFGLKWRELYLDLSAFSWTVKSFLNKRVQHYTRKRAFSSVFLHVAHFTQVGGRVFSLVP